MPDLQDRLKEFLGYLDIPMQTFERKSGIGQGLGSRLSNKSYATTFKRISNAYPQLNLGWLKTGEGEMLNTTPTYQTEQHDNNVWQGNNNVYFNGASPETIAYIQSLEKDVEHLKVCLAHKEDKIKDLNSIIDDKDKRIDEMAERIAELKQRIEELKGTK